MGIRLAHIEAHLSSNHLILEEGHILQQQADHGSEIQPQMEEHTSRKNRKAIREALADPREAGEDGGNAVELQSLIEQACNFYLKNGCFPDTYEEMQAIPVQQTAQLLYAGCLVKSRRQVELAMQRLISL